jgi:subtilisin family serine protease
MSFRVPRVLVVLGVALAASVALARSAERVIPGQKLFAELGPNERVTVLLDVVAGTPIKLSAKAFRGTTLRLDVSIADPDGVAVDVDALKKTNASSSLVTVKGWRPTRTGSYRIAVAALNSTRGGFDLAIAGAASKKLSGTGSIDAADGTFEIPFDALPGDRATCVLKRAKRSTVTPLVAKFVDAGGAETAIGATKQTTPVVVTTLGSSKFVVASDAGTTGAFTWTLKFVRAKAPKIPRDATELNAVGSITGVVVVDGQATRSASAGLAKRARPPRAPDIRVGELVVSVPAARSRAAVEAAAGAAMPGTRCTVVAAQSETGPYLVRVEHLAAWGQGGRAKAATRALAKSASASSAVAWCAPNAVVTRCDEPGDPLYGRQFYLWRDRLPNAWDRTQGDAAIVVAIVDTGSLFHPDLLGQYLPGYDFISATGTSLDGDGWDQNPADAAYELHGTHVAGIVGARAGNGQGIAGVVWHTKLLPVRVLGKDGGTFFDVAAGLRWAVGLPVPGAPVNANPARVVNMSLGAAYDDPTMRAAVEAALAAGAVICAAAGNEGSSARFYPAAYPGVIPVYALDQNQNWASYSNWGDWISIGAPGGDSYRGQPGILSTWYDTATGKPSYAELDGTSMATPQVSGIAALMLSLKPELTAAEIRQILETTAVDLGPPGFDVDFGWGAVDASKAIEHVLTPYAPPYAIDVAPSSLSFDGVSNQERIFVRTKAPTPVTISEIVVTTDVTSGWLTVKADAMATPATLTVTVDPQLDPGTYSGNIRLLTSVGVVDVGVRALRVPRPTLGYVLVSAVTELGQVVAQTSTSAAKDWQYALPGLPLGRYRIRAFADQNSNLLLDRVDEWDGFWPLRTQQEFLEVAPGALDAAEINVPLDRYDGRFDYVGVGAGRVAGAIALRATDARSEAPISGANVHLNGGAPLSLTDARGRAVLVGGFGGGQTVTATAGGFSPMTRSGQDAQYQGFALEPLSVAPTTTVTATVRGLTAADVDVWLQVGDAKGHAVHDASDPVFTLTYTSRTGPVPVSAAVFDVDGYPTRHALYEIDAPTATFDVPTTALPIGGAQARFVLPTSPAASFSASGATVTATTYLRWDDDMWIAVGDSVLAFGQSRQGWWADVGVFAPALPMKFEVVGTDASGRVVRQIFLGSTDNLQTAPNEAFTFPSPAALSSPANGATNVTLGPMLTWTTSTGARLHKIVIERVGTTWRWTIWTPGDTKELQLPALSTGGLESATDYRWSVETLRFASSFDATSYREARLDVEPTSRVFSGWASFRTQ